MLDKFEIDYSEAGRPGTVTAAIRKVIKQFGFSDKKIY